MGGFSLAKLIGLPKISAEGGKTDVSAGTIDWENIERLMGLDTDSNRLNRGNAFGEWAYSDPEYDDEGNITKRGGQQWSATSPGMKAAEERMDRRLAGEGFDPYEAPGQVSSITDALLASRMERMGLIDPGVADLKQDEYGTRFADRSGSPTAPPGGYPQPPSQAAPMPPQQGQPPMPPGAGQPPMPPGAGMPPGGSPPGGGRPGNDKPNSIDPQVLQMIMARGGVV